MNSDQLTFLTVKNIYETGLVKPAYILAAIAAASTMSVVGAIGATGLLFKTGASMKAAGKLERDLSPLHPGVHNLEYVDRVIIDDKEGLDTLLRETQQRSSIKEMFGIQGGTYLKSEYLNGEGHITSILPLSDKRALGLPGRTLFREAPDGYIGKHHFRPFVPHTGAANYYVRDSDRSSTNTNSLNLITFKTGNGPEVIAYNKKRTFIPLDESKTTFVHATDSLILQYLGSHS